MQGISTQIDISRYTQPVKTVRSNRQDALEYFFDMIDKESADRKWKYFDKKTNKYKKLRPINRRAYSIKMNTIFKNVEELRVFYAECMAYKHKHGSFSRRFFGGFNKQTWLRENG